MGYYRSMDGKYAVVTGSTRGIGRSIAETLARHGCNVVITSRNAGECRETASRLAEENGVATLGLTCDVSSQTEVSSLFGHVASWCAGQMDVLVCNAGYPLQEEPWKTPLHETPQDKLDGWYLGVFRTDAMGSVYCTREALPLMIARGRGSILYVSSISALTGFQGAPYTVAKAGILGLMKDVAKEYGRYNIRANALALGNIRTPATWDLLDAETRELFAQQAALRRWGSPEEVGNAALFLASDDSGFITGHTLVVDGGMIGW
ncbi:MAG: SDR family oxidoreductase [Acidobacteria bacterium]|nr:SDR family oxidoreductase [Acidobacteriota bacterium]